MDKQRYEQDKQKYEREIEEILEKFDKDPERKKKAEAVGDRLNSFRPSSSPSRKGPSLPTNWKGASAGQYIAAAFGVALLALIVRGFYPPLASVLVILSVVLFLVPIFLYRSTGTTTGGWSTHEEKRWRGQVIDFNTRRDITDDPLAAIKRWFKRR